MISHINSNIELMKTLPYYNSTSKNYSSTKFNSRINLITQSLFQKN